MSIGRRMLFSSLVALSALLASVGGTYAQEDEDEEGPIQAMPQPEMQMGDEQGAVIRAPTPGTRGATPIEIPFWPAIDPRKRPDLFKVLPLPVPGPEISEGRAGRFTYKENADGFVMGQTPFGYAYFRDLEQYREFLRKYR